MIPGLLDPQITFLFVAEVGKITGVSFAALETIVLECIDANPKLWNRIINYGDRAAELYKLEFEQPENYISDLQEELMMSAIAEIKGIDKEDIVINKKSNIFMTD